MFKLIAIALSLLVANQVIQANLLPYKDEPTEKVNEHLLSQLPEQLDLDENLEAASKWKQQLDKEPAADQKVIEVLSSLESLREILRQPDCDHQMYATVERSFKIVELGRFRYEVGISSSFRTQRLVKFAALKIALACNEQRKAEIAKKLGNLDSDLISRAKNLPRDCQEEGPVQGGRDLCTVDYQRVKGNFPNLVMTFLKGSNYEKNLKLRYPRLVLIKNRKKLVREDKVRLVVQYYISAPCNYLVSELGDLLDLSRKDSHYILFTKRGFRDSEAPRETLMPAYCLCRFFNKTGEQAIVKQAVLSVLLAQNLL